METKTDRNGKQTVYSYDIHGRLTRKAIGEAAIGYSYDNNDNQLTITDKTGTTARTYDEENRVITKKAPGFGTTTYTYDNTEGGGLYFETAEDFKHDLTKKVYDKAGRLYEVISDGKTTTYEYYGNGSRKTVTYSDGAKEEYTYYKDGLNKTLTNKKADGTVIDTYSYTYDEAHNQTSKTDRKGTTSYNYDSLNRLEKVTEPNGRTTNYTFDKAGNRLTETILAGATSVTTIYTYNEQNRLVSTVKRSGTETITDTYRFDNNGNTVSKTTETVKPVATSTSGGFSLEKSGKSTASNVTYYKFDVWNQLIKTTAGKKTATYSYNGEGYRVSKTENERTTNYLYEADKVVLETDVEGNETARNIYGTNLLTRTAQNDTMNYMYNGHGDVTSLIGENGAIQATYYYDAFGNITEQTGDVNNSVTYAGYQYDKETDLYYLNARYYDSKTARFLSEDTYTGEENDPLSLNLYTYCANEPVMYVDPSGHRTLEQGMSGDDVMDLQIKLSKLGYTGENGNTFKPTGYFGTDTLAALNKYKDKILPAGNRGSNRGLAGETTLAYLNYSYNMQYANSLIESNSRAYATNNAKYTFNQQISNVKSSNSPNKPVAPKPSTNRGTTVNSKGSGESASNNIYLSNLKPDDVTRDIAKWLIGNPINAFATQHPYITKALTGVDVLALFYAGGFVMDGDGVYHARQEWSIQSFKYSGYNDFYDTVFHYATSMEKAKFPFSDDKGNDYILWAWKGDYLNLGAGAEMGIYKNMDVNGNPTKHWLIDQSLAMPMTLTLDYNRKQIISYDPKKVDPQITDPLRESTDKWWVTGFNPDYQDVKASQLTATYTATFNTQAMYDDFFKKYGQGIDKDSRWSFDPKTNTAKFKF
ncbi:RHS repeat-associated core domain-containing protein [Clostridium sp. BNL1100]|uniref:RHS repeat-associated core domain-containing protein n=1 Tax=Clostridium sp. BNL1100 TaxID=755731 RepID=UPI002418ABEA|nr:RHS repeat-associated core domain-containing protein [Clostridium sp. BNL1100]